MQHGANNSVVSQSDLDKAIEALKAGKPAVFPTDTVYGIGVSVLHAKSPQAIYDIKQRAAGKPIAWLVGSPEALDVFGIDVPQQARDLVCAHWPGALTVIVKAGDAVPHAFASQAGTIGLRMPDSPVVLSLIKAVGSPLATSSANISGSPDPQVLEDVDSQVLRRVAAVVRCGRAGSGLPSTVIDCSHGTVQVLRQGLIK